MRSSRPSKHVLPLRALVVGADGVTLHRQTKAWLAQYLTSEGESLDSDRWDAAALSPESLHDALQSLPMLQSVRVLVIHHVENLKKEADSVLDAFLDDPNPHLALLLTGSKVDQRKRWVKKVKDQDGLVDCPLPKRHQWLGWLRAQGTELNVDITEDAAHLLVEWVGEDPWRLFQELHKLSDYVGEVRRIQLRDVETMVAGLPAADIFQTLDATFEGRAYEGMQGLRRLLRHDEPALRIHAMFIRHARILLNLRLWMAQGVRNPQELAPKLGVHPFFVRRYIDQAARWPTNKLIQLVELLAQSEKNIKGGRSLPEAVLIEDCLMGVLALGRDRLSVRSQPQPHR